MCTQQPVEPVGRAEPSVKRKAAGSSNWGSPGRLGHVLLSLLPGGESRRVSMGSYRLRLSLSPSGVNTGNMAESDCIEDHGGGGRGSMTLETPTLVSCLLTSSPNDVNLVDQVLAQSEKAFAQRLH